MLLCKYYHFICMDFFAPSFIFLSRNFDVLGPSQARHKLYCTYKKPGKIAMRSVHGLLGFESSSILEIGVLACIKHTEFDGHFHLGCILMLYIVANYPYRSHDFYFRYTKFIRVDFTVVFFSWNCDGTCPCQTNHVVYYI